MMLEEIDRVMTAPQRFWYLGKHGNKYYQQSYRVKEQKNIKYNSTYTDYQNAIYMQIVQLVSCGSNSR